MCDRPQSGTGLVCKRFPMSLLPVDAQFEELVQDCYLAFRGSGVTISPLDAELVSQWAALNVPYEVVARGIRRAAERAMWDARPDEPAVRTLRACQREVSAEIKKYLDRAVGKRPEPAPGTATLRPAASVEESRRRKLCACLKRFAKHAPQFDAAIARLLKGPLSRTPESLRAAARLEDEVVAVLSRALPFAERVELERIAKARVAEAPSLSARARLLSRRFHRAALARQRLDLPTFW
jgi:hypothetical protein